MVSPVYRQDHPVDVGSGVAGEQQRGAHEFLELLGGVRPEQPALGDLVLRRKVDRLVNGRVSTALVLQGDRLHDVLTVSGALVTLGETMQVSLSSDPPLPGLSFVLGVDWSVPHAPPSAEAGLSVERELPKTLRVGVPVDVTLRAVAPGGQPMTVTLGLPAGVDAVTRSLEQLQEGGTITSFTVVEGIITLQVPARAQGELMLVSVQVVPTLAGTVRERLAQDGGGGVEVLCASSPGPAERLLIG